MIYVLYCDCHLTITQYPTLCNTNLFKESVINMGIQLRNKVPVKIWKLNMYTPFKRELKSAFLSIHEFVSYRLDDKQESYS